MDGTEQLAGEYLANQRIGDVVYEPDGNVPPDFLVGGRIAVEVRRLNQHEDTESGPRGLEETSIPIGQHIQRFIKTLGPSDPGESWFVFHTIRRPVPSWKRVQRFLRDHLTDFADQDSRTEVRYALDKGFKIRLFPASKPHSTFFVPAGSTDHDSGGWVLAELLENIPICIEDKTKKVSRFRDKYSLWWLLLVDYIGYGLNTVDRTQLRSLVDVSGTWDRIILVNPLDARNGCCECLTGAGVALESGERPV